MEKSKNEEVFINETLLSISEIMKKTIDKCNEIENIQKLYALTSFIEFIRCGASVKLMPIEKKQATFIVEME